MFKEAPKEALPFLNSIGMIYPKTLLHSREPLNENETAGGPEYLTRKERDDFAEQLGLEILEKVKSGKSPLYESWCLEYYLNMYLSDCSASEYNEQWDYCFKNLLELNDKGLVKAGLEAYHDEKSYWVRRFQHLLCESQFRGGIPALAGQQESSYKIFENLTLPINNIPESDWNRHWIFKFGKSSYLKPQRDDEIIRFSPNTSFSDPSLNHAQRDEEGNSNWLVPSSSLPIGAVRHESGAVLELETSNIIISQRATYPFYVWCASGQYRPIIANAFEYDCVLVIRDRKRFIRDLTTAVEKSGYVLPIINEVTYYDPFKPYESNLNEPLPFLKHHKFMYQKEIRAVISEPRPDVTLEHFFIKIPGMRKYSHIEYLRNDT